MTPKVTPENETPARKTEPDSEPAGVHPHDEHRKHGYRGYPNNPNPNIGGDIHTGSGFAGVGAPSGSGSSGSGLITEKTREAVREQEELDETGGSD